MGTRSCLLLLLAAVVAVKSEGNSLLTFKLFTESKKGGEVITMDNMDEIKLNLPVVIGIPGWIDCGFVDYFADFKDALIKRGGYNIIVVDWSDLACANSAVQMCLLQEVVGVQVAEFINILHKIYGYPLGDVHIVGQSLGGQIAGVAGGKVIEDNEGNKVGRITALDPSSKKQWKCSRELSQSDAEFLMVVHTDKGGLGIGTDVGHVDINMNSGSAPQPGCTGNVFSRSNQCSHAKAMEYFNEAVNPTKNNFVGNSCVQYVFSFLKWCDRSTGLQLSLEVDKAERGTFDFRTNDMSPFGQTSIM